MKKFLRKVKKLINIGKGKIVDSYRKKAIKKKLPEGGGINTYLLVRIA